MFREGCERLHSKASLQKTRKASKWQTFACVLQSECSEKNRKRSREMPMLESYFSNITIWQNKTPPRTFPEICPDFFFGTAISQKSSARKHVRNLYLFSKPISYCCRRVVQRQLSKCIHRNADFLQNTGKILNRPKRNRSICPEMF